MESSNLGLNKLKARWIIPICYQRVICMACSTIGKRLILNSLLFEASVEKKSNPLKKLLKMQIIVGELEKVRWSSTKKKILYWDYCRMLQISFKIFLHSALIC